MIRCFEIKRSAQIRFLFPVLPAFTVAAACGMERLWKTRRKSAMHVASCWGALAVVAASAAAVVAFTQASVANYPGAHVHCQHPVLSSQGVSPCWGKQRILIRSPGPRALRSAQQWCVVDPNPSISVLGSTSYLPKPKLVPSECW